MSFLGRGSAPPPGGINPERIEIATAEYVRLQQHGASLFTDIRTLLRLDMITDVFNRLVSLAVSFKLASSMRNRTYNLFIVGHVTPSALARATRRAT